MIKALVISTKNAPTKGNMIKAVGAGPCDFVTAVIFAMAVGVAPNENPAKPALRTAERYPPPIHLKNMKMINNIAATA